MIKTCLVVPMVLAAMAAAQESPSGDVMFRREVRVEGQQGPGAQMTFFSPAGAETMQYVSAEMSLDGKAVKGAPYSADATTETTQALADGNRIHRQTTSKIYRDSEGRTRREEALGAVGPFATGPDSPQIIMINDPAAGVNYVLNARDHTAHKMVLRRMTTGGGFGVGTGKGGVMGGMIGPPGSGITATAVAPPPEGAVLSSTKVIKRLTQNQPTSESLGMQLIEGVQAEGTRTTITIPAGEIGNEQPIQIVSERWYSPELQTVVMSKSNDPRMGETVYKLTNINRSEPSPSLFQVPPDYTLSEGKASIQTFERKIEQK